VRTLKGSGALNAIAEPAREVTLWLGGAEAFVKEDDGAVVMLVPDAPPKRLCTHRHIVNVLLALVGALRKACGIAWAKPASVVEEEGCGSTCLVHGAVRLQTVPFVSGQKASVAVVAVELLLEVHLGVLHVGKRDAKHDNSPRMPICKVDAF
jgi:hypothetical protein